MVLPSYYCIMIPLQYQFGRSGGYAVLVHKVPKCSYKCYVLCMKLDWEVKLDFDLKFYSVTYLQLSNMSHNSRL